jgi:hypothetical protein
LRESKVGKVINYMTKDEEVMADLRKRCQALMGGFSKSKMATSSSDPTSASDKWSKFIIDKYAKPADRPSFRSPIKKERRDEKDLEEKDDEGNEYRYARVPKPMNLDLRIQPQSQWTATEARKSGKGDEPSRFKKLSNALSQSKSGSRAAPKVLQG